MPGALQGKSAVVTGASRGIGVGIAIALASAGARVALVARTRAELEKRAKEISNGAFAVQCDLTAREEVDRAAGEIPKELGDAPDILVNNAGVFEMSLSYEMEKGLFERMLDINLIGPFRFAHAFLPAMKKRGSGDIVGIGSIADRKVFEGNTAYSASKFGLRAMHEVWREEFKGTGLRSILVSPASVDTPLWDTVNGSSGPPNRANMLRADAVVAAVMFALTQPADVNVYELRLAHS